MHSDVRIMDDDEWIPRQGDIAFLADNIVVPADDNGDPVVVTCYEDFLYWFGERPMIAPMSSLTRASNPSASYLHRLMTLIKRIAGLN